MSSTRSTSYFERMTSPVFYASFEHIITHVFFPLKLPSANDCTIGNDFSLASAVCGATRAYTPHVRGTSEEDRWRCITKMLDNLRASVQSERLDKDLIISQLRGMETGDMITFFIRFQNAAIILTKRENSTLFESFEVSPRMDAVEQTPGSLLCSYPWYAAEMPNEVFDHEGFQSELAHFLSLPGAIDSDLRFPRDNPEYVTALLTGILQGIGRPSDVATISKRIRDEVGAWPPDRTARLCDWRRSALWLLIRVAIQMSVERSSVGRVFYKQFILYLICTLARDSLDADIIISGDLLHLMSSKILRRLSKLGPSAPDWLSEIALKTCACLRESLDDRWKKMSVRRPPFRNPSQAELVKDTKLSFLNSGEHIRKVLSIPDTIRPRTPFDPNHRRRGTLQDFLSLDGSFFDEAYDADPEVTMYDVEHSVEQEIDDWIAHVVDVDDACARLHVLMDLYYGKKWSENPEDKSIKVLTLLELCIALDKLAVQDIPMLADYSFGFQAEWLEELCLHKTMSLHRLSCAYLYLVARELRSHPGWSVLSDELTEDSFPIRYYDQSPYLQHFKARIEEEQDHERPTQQLAQDEGLLFSKLSLPAQPLHAKVIVFELQCPPVFRIWRSTLAITCDTDSAIDKERFGLLTDVVEQWRSQLCLVYFYQSRNTPILRYLLRKSDRFWSWYHQQPDSFRIERSYSQPLQYVKSTSHTSNRILAEQFNCPVDLSLDEFIAFGHLRSGASLQWLNILHGLRNRTLNLRRKQAHYLLAQAAFQVGPLDASTATWIWHQELQDMSFCNALIDGLNSLFVDLAGLIDWVFMRTILLLLTRILASSPGMRVSERAIALLRRVRRKTFSWVQELSYDLQMAPMNEERKNSLLRMAATCRSTFDVDRATFPQLIHSAEDVDALLSCFFFIQALGSSRLIPESRISCSFSPDSSDSCLTLAPEVMTRDTVLADPSNRGLDLAIARIFANYRPCAFGSEPLGYPNTRWLTCKTKAVPNKPSRTVHINLLDGQIRVDGQVFGRLPPEIKDHDSYKEIFRDNGCFVVPSDLPGMDFMSLIVTSSCKVHFSLRGDNLVVRAQCNQTNQVLEYIPSKMLYRDLPLVLVDGHVHWLNTSSGVIEIRPHQQRWEQSEENWRIECASESYRAYKGHESLVDIRSPTWAMLSLCLDGLTDENMWGNSNILITTSPADSVKPTSRQQLIATLPRSALLFFVNDREELESRDFRHMVYDEDQCIQTLFGLLDFIVLRPTAYIGGLPTPEALIHRVALVREKYDRVNCYNAFKVDPELGCLVWNGDIESLQHLAYLHATTSLHRPDPLTGKMGTQAALDFFHSVGCCSAMRLKVFCNDYIVQMSDTYPQLVAVHDEPKKMDYYRNDATADLLRKRAARRAAHLFPQNADQLASSEARNDLDYAVPNSSLELHDIGFVISSAVHRWSTHTPTMDIISSWTEIWGANMLVEPASNPDGCPRMPTDSNLVQMLMSRVHDILEEKEGTRQHFQLLFLLPTLAYCSSSHQTAFLSMLVAFTPQKKACSGHAIHMLSYGYRPTEQVIRDHIRTFHVKDDVYLRDNLAVGTVVNRLLSVWPSDLPPTIQLGSSAWNTERLTASLQQLLLSYHNNWSLKERLIHILTAELGLPTLPCRVQPVQYTFSPHTPSQITLNQLLSNRLPPRLPQRSTLPPDGLPSNSTPSTSDDIPSLDQLFSLLRTNSTFQQDYLALLETSASAGEQFRTPHGVATKDDIDMLQKHFTKCRTNYADALCRLKNTLGPITDVEQALEEFGQWPPITANVLLCCLASTSRTYLSDKWKQCLMSFAQLLLELQRSRRLLRFALDGLEEEFWKELENEQCDGWNPDEYPDWLLIQVQGDFLIRRAQAETAMQLMFPQSGGNTVMQVNMGEGKSSVIIPIVACALADGKQLVRVIVPKALAAQMFDTLVARLGRLSNRPIYYLPFSRHGTVYNNFEDELSVVTLHGLMSRCMVERGILLVQPEHIVSLKLMSVEEQIRGESTVAESFQSVQRSICQQIMTASLLTRGLSSHGSLVDSIFRWLGYPPNLLKTSDSGGSASDSAKKWLDLQKWVHSNVRDILDESDEILHPRFQLNYTIGLEKHMDGYPDRWTITQQILHLVKEHVHTLSRNHLNSVEYERGPPGSFPRVRIARASDVGRWLISMVVKDVMAGRLPNFNFQQISSAALRDAIRSFISDKDILQVSDTAKTVEEYAKRPHQSYLWSGLLLLRGLLSSNILLFALSERRWRVDYGLDEGYSATATTLAVPYRAKDVPAPNTQFGHPDLTIILTCLAYYYTGLTEEQLRASFQMLLDQDDPIAEYKIWIEDYDLLPDPLRNLSDINPRSSEEWDNFTFPLFSHNHAVINFYLSRVVFPREAKEFPWKLCGSSWDLGEKRENLVTGFSGTSDSRWLLPMSVVQHDLDTQRGASSNVLARLLRQEQGKDSKNYIVTHENGQRQTTHKFLDLVAIQRPEIRVLLDVGAQILDLSNHQVSEAWLSIVRNAEAAIYFGENDQLMVLPRNGKARPLSSSPLSQQLDKCVVYLDHPHTRGTDLKFPVCSRAAVTLGPKVTKDALVQGCMRMRKLGHGHSIMFFAPPGVDQSIRAVTGNQDRDAHITISDILSWTIRETWADIQHRAPYWAQQSLDHQSRYDALSRFCNNELTPRQLSDTWLQPNCKSLADLYAPRESEDKRSDLSAVQGIQQRCKDLGILSLPNGQLEEEQEREVHREREREREVELPPKAEHAEHLLHPDVVSFVKTGVIHSGGAFLPVFTTLELSTAATRDADVWSPSILATVDFSRTIKPESTKGTMDKYLRPVQWILSGKTDRGPVLVILSPFEANLLMPDIRVNKHVHLHLYAPRTAERMQPSDDLRLYAIPPLPSDWTPPWELIDQLNVFAGQLYLRNYQSYLRLCHFLDVPTNESPDSRKKVRRNLFKMPGTFEEMEVTFADSPLPTVMALLAIRNQGRPFDHTHMGKILQGQVLTKKDFERPKPVIGDRSPLPPTWDVEDGAGSSALPRPLTRGLEADGSSETEDSEPSQKRARATDEATTISPMPPDDARNQPGSSRVFRRPLETAERRDTIQEPMRKRPRVD